MYNDPNGYFFKWLGRKIKKFGRWVEKSFDNLGDYLTKHNVSIGVGVNMTPGGGPTTYNASINGRQVFNSANDNQFNPAVNVERGLNQMRMGESITSGNLAYQNAMVSEGIRNSVSMLPPAGQGPNWVPQGQGGSLGGWAAVAKDAASELYYSEKFGTWMGKNFTLYKQTWGGNGVTGGKLKFAKKTSTGIKIGGYAIAAYNAYSVNEQYRNGEISNGWMVTEQISNVYSTFGGLYGAAWGLGWELGRTITNTEWYQEAKFNFWYNYWESKVGSPSQSNENMWIYFYQNYKP